MNYKQTQEYLFEKLPMFHRSGPLAYKANLDNTKKICALLGNPETKFKSIHVAGTNGKGSSSHMLAAVLQAAGYKVGLFTSPHLLDFRERIKINGIQIKKSLVTNFIKRNLQAIEKIQPSFFEMTVGLAFEYFASEKVDVAVIETGLGGRLDSTNVLHPEVALITNIGLDHTDLLGDTVEKIAFEKAGIIKPGVPVVISEEQEATAAVFSKKALDEGAPLIFASRHFKANRMAGGHNSLCCTISFDKKSYFESLGLDLTGIYQLKNIAGVLQVLEILKEKGYKIDKELIKKGLGAVKKRTGIKGRWHILRKSPLTICDTGHNTDGIRQVTEQLKSIPYEDLHFILGVVKDKDCAAVLALLPKNAHYYFCKADIPRALDENILMQQATQFQLKGKAYSSVKNALKAAQDKAGAKDLIFIGGSTFVVAEIIK
jgi:dihydrofolate synthase/folylpolyglutamate synthase